MRSSSHRPRRNSDVVPTVFERWTEFIVRRRWLVIFLTSATTVGMGYLALGVTTNNDYETWLPSHDRVSTLYQETDREFSSNALLFICLEFQAHGVFHPDALMAIDRLTRLFESRPEAFHVMSLTNVFDMRATADGLEVRKLIPHIPSGTQELEELSQYVRSREMYVNTLISPDARYAAILINIKGTYDEVEVASTFVSLLEREAQGLHYYFGGDPALAHYIDVYMARDMKTLVPLALIIISLVLAFGLKSWHRVILPLSVVAVSIVWTLGLHRVFGMPMNLMTPAAIVLLIAMGSDYAVHTMNHCMATRQLHKGGAEISLPIIMSALTTTAGLATFATTRIKVLSDFGYALICGLAAACGLSITFLLALFALMGGRAATSSEDALVRHSDHIYSRTLEGLCLFVLRHHLAFLGAVALLCIVAGAGIARLHTDVDIVTMLPEDSPPRRGHDLLNEHFGGIYPLSIYSRGDHQEPSVLMLQLRLEHFLRSHPSLGGYTSIAGIIAEMNYLLTDIYTIPETREGVANLWILLENEPSLSLCVNESRDKALLNARIQGSDMSTMRALAHFVAERIPPDTKEELVTLDLAKMSREKQAIVRSILLDAAAEELSWLTQGYSGGSGAPLASLRQAIEDALHRIPHSLSSEKVLQALTAYCRDQGVEPSLPTSKGHWLDRFTIHYSGDQSGMWLHELAPVVAQERHWSTEDATAFLEGALFQCNEILRKEKTDVLLASVLTKVPQSLALDTEFLKRARGILWKVFSNMPALPISVLPQDPDIASAQVKRVAVRLDQTGAPDVFRRFDELLIQSQVQSLALATLMVLTMVSLLHRSLKRGILSVIAILVPLVYMLGLMGWTGIPLNFGTVLVGALILGLGIDGSIHIIYFESLNLRGKVPAERALLQSIRHVGRAVLTANSTTVAGFLVTLLSSSKALKQFSSVNALAIVLVTVSVFTLLPALFKATGSLSKSDPAYPG